MQYSSGNREGVQRRIEGHGYVDGDPHNDQITTDVQLDAASDKEMLYTGVRRRLWTARYCAEANIRVDGKEVKVTLENFSLPEQAARVHDIAKISSGLEQDLNFPLYHYPGSLLERCKTAGVNRVLVALASCPTRENVDMSIGVYLTNTYCNGTDYDVKIPGDQSGQDPDVSFLADQLSCLIAAAKYPQSIEPPVPTSSRLAYELTGLVGSKGFSHAQIKHEPGAGDNQGMSPEVEAHNRPLESPAPPRNRCSRTRRCRTTTPKRRGVSETSGRAKRSGKAKKEDMPIPPPRPSSAEPETKKQRGTLPNQQNRSSNDYIQHLLQENFVQQSETPNTSTEHGSRQHLYGSPYSVPSKFTYAPFSQHVNTLPGTPTAQVPVREDPHCHPDVWPPLQQVARSRASTSAFFLGPSMSEFEGQHPNTLRNKRTSATSGGSIAASSCSPVVKPTQSPAPASDVVPSSYSALESSRVGASITTTYQNTHRCRIYTPQVYAAKRLAPLSDHEMSRSSLFDDSQCPSSLFDDSEGATPWRNESQISAPFESATMNPSLMRREDQIQPPPQNDMHVPACNLEKVDSIEEWEELVNSLRRGSLLEPSRVQSIGDLTLQDMQTAPQEMQGHFSLLQKARSGDGGAAPPDRLHRGWEGNLVSSSALASEIKPCHLLGGFDETVSHQVAPAQPELCSPKDKSFVPNPFVDSSRRNTPPFLDDTPPPLAPEGAWQAPSQLQSSSRVQASPCMQTPPPVQAPTMGCSSMESMPRCDEPSPRIEPMQAPLPVQAPPMGCSSMESMPQYDQSSPRTKPMQATDILQLLLQHISASNTKHCATAAVPANQCSQQKPPAGNLANDPKLWMLSTPLSSVLGTKKPKSSFKNGSQ